MQMHDKIEATSYYLLHLLVVGLGAICVHEFVTGQLSVLGRISSVVIFLLLLLLYLFQYRIAAASRQREKETERTASMHRQLTEAISVGARLRKVIRHSDDLLVDQITDLCPFFVGRQPSGQQPTKQRTQLVSRILKRMCDIFSDQLEPRAQLDASFFKATLFELVIDESKQILKRAYWHYPAPRIPRTDEIDIKTHHRAGAVRCYGEREIIIVEDVPSEQEYWEDLRPAQRQEYKSMICIPLLWRTRGEDPVSVGNVTLVGKDTVRFVGVITIDTNIERFFKRADTEAIRQLLAPFLIHMRLAYVIYPEG